MATETTTELMTQLESLPLDEQLRLAAYLVERARHLCQPPEPRPRWRDIRGMGSPSFYGEEAQEWVSRTRRESDEQRQEQWMKSDETR